MEKIRNLPQVRKESPTKYAQSIVEQGPRDDLTRFDALGHTSLDKSQINLTVNKYINSLETSYTSLSKTVDSFNNLLTGDTKSVLDKIKEAQNVIDSQVKRVTDEFADAKKRLETDLLGGRSIESILALPKNVKRNALGTLEEYTKGLTFAGLDIGHIVREGKMAYKDAVGIYNAAKSGDWTSIQGISNALGAMGNAGLSKYLTSIVDLQATSAYVGALMQQVSDLGIVDLYREMSDLFHSDKEKKRYIAMSVENSISRSDINMIQTAVDIIGGDQVYYNYPDIIERILSSYRFDFAYEPSKLPQYRSALINLLNSINPSWYYEQIEDKKFTKLSSFTRISRDAVTVFSYDLDEDNPYNFSTEIALARYYPEIDAKALVMQMYPEIFYHNVSE